MMKQVDRDLNMAEMPPAQLENSPAPPEHYPCIHFEGPEELDLPATGTMLVHYKVKREVETKNPQDPTRDWYACDIEVQKIIAVKPHEDMRPSKRDTSAEDSLDKLMKEKQQQEEGNE